MKKRNTLTKLIFSFCLVFISFINAQSQTIVKYFDSDWNKTSKDSAFFYTEMIKEKKLYKCTSYWMASKKLNCISTYTDTGFVKPVGLLLRYYENGQVQDSMFYGEQAYNYRFYENGKLWVKYTYNSKSKKEVTDGYDETGKKINNFIYEKEASFRGGLADWQDYLVRNLKVNTPVKNGAPAGKYQVMIKFIVGKDGRIQDATAETAFGYGMEEEAIRVIKNSPKWNAAIQINKPVNAYRRQPITFMVDR